MTILDEMLGVEAPRTVDEFLTELIGFSRKLNQHHVKVDYWIDHDQKPKYTYIDVDGNYQEKYADGVGVILDPKTPVYGPGVYAFSLDRSKTVYVGANLHKSENTVYNRILRFGKAIYNRLSETETHQAGKRYRELYGETTQSLYVSYVMYDQLPDNYLQELEDIGYKVNDLEKLFIRKFRSKYLLNYKVL